MPQIEEKFEPEKPKTVIEEALSSPVSIEFEDIHINDIVSFLTDTYSINIVVDTRAVEAPQKNVPNQGGAPGAPGPGGFPGGPPGAFPGGPGAFPTAVPQQRQTGRDRRESRGSGLSQFAANNPNAARGVNGRPGQLGAQGPK